MNSRYSRVAPSALAFALLSISSAFPAHAQPNTESALPAVVVVGSRFASDPQLSPVGATVITAQQIRDAGIVNVNEAVRKLGNVYGRQGLLSPGNFSLDLRGFGATGDQNIVVLVDGIRLSESEQATAQLTSIPIESVERIEIVRGGSSVLYGEGATGGTIQIVTRQPQRNRKRATLFGEAGNFGHRAGRASFTGDWDGVALDVHLSRLDQDGYRRNSASRDENASISLQRSFDGGRFGLRAEQGTQDFRLPGALSLAEFRADPRATNTPLDYASLDSRRYTLFAERQVGKLDVAAELSTRDKASRQFGRFPFAFDTSTTQFSPRVRWLTASADIKNELVFGMDFTRWRRDVSGKIATQDAHAIYVRDEVLLGKWRMSAGARHERFDKTDTGYQIDQSANAWEVQAAYAATAAAELYAKAGNSYRIPSADDNAFLARPLQPQKSRDLEAGAVLGNAQRKLVARVFRHELDNEIFYDPTVFANVNLDPTRRQGVELEANASLGAGFSLVAAWQRVSARFVGGPNAGREMILVPRDTASLRLNWLPGGPQSATLGMRWAGQQRYGNDFTNACTGRIPAYAVVDGRYAYRSGPWEFAATGTNLTNRSYFSNAFNCVTGNVYPEAGRQLRVSVRREF